MIREQAPEFPFSRFIDLFFLAIVLLGLFEVISFFGGTGYLPAPFIHDRNDTYMDWYIGEMGNMNKRQPSKTSL